jgi:hypothetical protein
MDSGEKLSQRLQAAGRTGAVASAAETTRLSEKVVGRARRHFLTLSVIAAVLWVFAAVGFIAIPLAVLIWVWPPVEAAVGHAIGDSWANQIGGTGRALLYGACVWGCMVVLAGLSTVALVWSSRRATLGQIQQSLAELTDEVRRLSDRNPE